MLIRMTAMGLTLAATVFLAAPAAERPERIETTPASASAAATYNVDTVHSSVIFRIKHAGVAHFYGRFNRITGTIEWNDDDPTASTLNFDIPTASVDTANDRRDAHLRSDDFFSADEHSSITFRSSSIERDGEKFKVTGDLTLRGVTKSIDVELEHTGSAGPLIGLHSTFTIKRTDFDMPFGVENGSLGDEVKLLIGIEGRRAPTDE